MEGTFVRRNGRCFVPAQIAVKDESPPPTSSVGRLDFIVFPVDLRPEEREAYFRALGVGESRLPGVLSRCGWRCIQTSGIKAAIADLLREESQAMGVEIVLPEAWPSEPAPIAIMAHAGQLAALAGHIKSRLPALRPVAEALNDCLTRIDRPRTLLAGGRDLLAGRAFLIMGIVNVTPDSFSDGGRFLNPQEAIAHGIRMVEEGAHILDLGAESSRPGSDPVGETEELRRLMPVLDGLRKALPEMVLSVDTTKAAVAAAALDGGADLINDISGGAADAGMLSLCARRGVPVVLMHMRSAPKTMQAAPHYADPVAEVTAELRARVEAAEAEGLGPGQLVVDPGFGFAKRPADNLACIAHLEALSSLGYPILVGASRKSSIGAITGAPVDERLPGTIALHTAALLKGASIFRVHDVKAHAQALTCAAALLKPIPSVPCAG